MSREDADIAEATLAIMENEGINVLLNTKAQQVSAPEAGSIAVHIAQGRPGKNRARLASAGSHRTHSKQR